MGLLQFCASSVFFFLTPSLALISISHKRWFVCAFTFAAVVLLGYGLWLFPQLAAKSLAYGTLIFDLYCYLVLSTGTVVGSIVKAIELKSLWFIPFILFSIAAINGIAVFYSFY